MPNEYSIDIHNYISGEIAAHEQNLAIARTSGDKKSAAYSLGQLKELGWLREYLAEKIDLKHFTYY